MTITRCWFKLMNAFCYIKYLFIDTWSISNSYFMWKALKLTFVMVAWLMMIENMWWEYWQQCFAHKYKNHQCAIVNLLPLPSSTTTNFWRKLWVTYNCMYMLFDMYNTPSFFILHLTIIGVMDPVYIHPTSKY